MRISRLYLQKNYSQVVAGGQPQSFNQRMDEIEKKTDVGMTNLGRAGLVAAGGLGLGAAYQAGSGLYQVKKLVPDVKKIAKTAYTDQATRSLLEKGATSSLGALGQIPGLGGFSQHAADFIKNNGVDKAKYVYDNTKFSKLQRFKRMWRIGDSASRINRTVLKNAEGYSNMLFNNVLSNTPGLTDVQKNLVKDSSSVVGKLGKAALKLQNSRYLGRAALAVGGLSGAAYLHGRELQSYRQMVGNNNNNNNGSNGSNGNVQQ